jgi:hypothetical protein
MVDTREIERLGHNARRLAMAVFPVREAWRGHECRP